MVGEFQLNLQFWTDSDFCSTWSDRVSLRISQWDELNGLSSSLSPWLKTLMGPNRQKLIKSYGPKNNLRCVSWIEAGFMS